MITNVAVLTECLLTAYEGKFGLGESRSIISCLMFTSLTLLSPIAFTTDALLTVSLVITPLELTLTLFTLHDCPSIPDVVDIRENGVDVVDDDDDEDAKWIDSGGFC